MTVTIRRAVAEDIDPLARVGLLSWTTGIRPHVPEPAAQRIEAANPFLPFLRQMGPRVWVAQVGAELAGLGACEHADDLISDVWVGPAFSGQGVGAAIMRTLETEIAERGFAAARLEVVAANTRAIGFYGRLGYAVAWRARRWDEVIGIEWEKVGMTRRLRA